jgi:transcriptional regulator with XRE-family HTH domain
MDIRRIVGRNVRRLRKENGWSQERLALECGIHRTYIGDVERGERNISVVNVHRIAQALGVEPWVLLRFEDPTKRSAAGERVE